MTREKDELCPPEVILTQTWASYHTCTISSLFRVVLCSYSFVDCINRVTTQEVRHLSYFRKSCCPQNYFPVKKESLT